MVPFREPVQRWHEQGVEGPAIWQLLVEQHGFTGSYSSLKRFLRRLDPPAVRATVRVEVAPGEEAPPVRLRTRGPRSFHEIPPSEVLAVVRELRTATSMLEGEELLSAVLQFWEIGRTTSQIRERFTEILRGSEPGSYQAQ